MPTVRAIKRRQPDSLTTDDFEPSCPILGVDSGGEGEGDTDLEGNRSRHRLDFEDTALGRLLHDDDESSQRGRRSRCLSRKSCVAGSGMLLVAVICSIVVSHGDVNEANQKENPSESVGLSLVGAALSMMGTMAEGMRAGTSTYKALKSTSGTLKKSWNSVNHSFFEAKLNSDEMQEGWRQKMLKKAKWKAKLAMMNETERKAAVEKLLDRLNISAKAHTENGTLWFEHIRAMADLNDGNVCYDDEELDPNANLCYKKCDLITGGDYPIRRSAFACCAMEPCGGLLEKSEMGFCSGFAIGGRFSGNGCPHSPGGCLEDEELFGNTCYQKCGLLTLGMFKHRSGPVTCCMVPDQLAMFQVGNCATNTSYAVGGGQGDGRQSTPAAVHPPMLSITEACGSFTTSATCTDRTCTWDGFHCLDKKMVTTVTTVTTTSPSTTTMSIGRTNKLIAPHITEAPTATLLVPRTKENKTEALKADCHSYLSTTGCSWTSDYNCPGQRTGKLGPAENDGHYGYTCCCLQNMWKMTTLTTTKVTTVTTTIEAIATPAVTIENATAHEDYGASYGGEELERQEMNLKLELRKLEEEEDALRLRKLKLRKLQLEHEVKKQRHMQQ